MYVWKMLWMDLFYVVEKHLTHWMSSYWTIIKILSCWWSVWHLYTGIFTEYTMLRWFEMCQKRNIFLLKMVKKNLPLFAPLSIHTALLAGLLVMKKIIFLLRQTQAKKYFYTFLIGFEWILYFGKTTKC